MEASVSRPPFALDRLHIVDDRSDQILYILPGPDPSGRTALRLSALELLARIYEIFPLICPTCQTPLTFIAFLTEPELSPEDDFDQSWGG